MNRFRLAALVMSWMLLSGIVGTGLIGPNRSAIEGEYHLSHAQFGLAIALIQITISLGILLCAAPRLRRHGSVLVLMAGLAFQTIGFAAIFTTRSLSGLGLGWMLITLGTVVGSITNNISMALWPDNPRKGVTMLHAFNAIGKVTGPLIAALCLTANWRLSFLAAEGITFALLAAFYVSRDQIRIAPPDTAGKTPPDPGKLFRRPFYWFSAVLPFALIAGGEAAFVTLLPLYLEKVKGVSAGTASLLLTVHLIGLMLGRFATASLNQRISNRIIIGGCLAMGVFVFPGLYVEHAGIRAISLLLMGWLFSSTWPTYYAQASRFYKENMQVLAYGSAFGNVLGISLCIYCSSLIADRSLPLSLLFGPAVLWLFGALFYGSRLSR